ncbi:MAG: MotE family protein [Pseudomonadota bacterium]
MIRAWLINECCIFVLVGLISSQFGMASETTLSSLDQREKKLQEREQALLEQLSRHEKTIQELRVAVEKEKNASEERLKAQEISWKKRILEMEKELKSKTEELNTSREKQLTNFLGIYEKMEPKQAAKVLESTDAKLATQIITQMKAQRAAEVLAKMSPEKARVITEAGLMKQKKTVSQKVNEVTENSPIAPIGDTEKN